MESTLLSRYLFILKKNQFNLNICIYEEKKKVRRHMACGELLYLRIKLLCLRIKN